MAKDPSFPLYAQDFLVDTIQLDEELVGAYMRILCVLWINGKCHSDANAIAKISHSAPKVLEVLKDKFTFHGDGTITNNKMEEIRAKRIENREKLKKAGETGAKKRWQSQCDRNGEAIGDANGDEMAKEKEKEKVQYGSNEFDIKQVDEFWMPYIEQNYKTVKLNRDQFIDDVRKLREIDKLSEQDIKNIQNIISDESNFWNDKIGTPGKLRKRSDKTDQKFWEMILRQNKNKNNNKYEFESKEPKNEERAV